MSFPDLAQLAQQTAPPPSVTPTAPQPQPPQADPSKLPPDPKELPPLSGTNLASRAGPTAGNIPAPIPQQAEEKPDDLNWWRENLKNLYMSATPDNIEAKDFGQDDWTHADAENYAEDGTSPYHPTPAAAYGVLQNSSGRMKQWGSPEVAAAAGEVNFLSLPFVPILDMFSHGKFSANYSAAAMRGLQIQQMQMIGAAIRAREVSNAQMQKFGDVFIAAQSGVLTPQEAEEKIRELGANDPTLLTFLNERGVKGVYELLKHREAEARDMAAATTSLRRATGYDKHNDAAVGEAWGMPGGGDEGVGLPGKGGAVEKPAAGPDTSELGGFDASVAKHFKLSPRMESAAQTLVSGAKPDGYDDLKRSRKGAEIKARIDAAADGIKALVRRAARDPALDQEGRLEKIAGYNETLANQARALLSYEENPQKDIGGIKDRPDLLRLVRDINPHWNSNGFAITQKYHDPNLPSVRVIQRVSSFIPAINQVNSALLRIDPNQNLVKGTVDKLWKNTFTGDPTYPQLFTGITNAIQETQAIVSGTGRPSVTIAKERAKHMLETMSPAQIRTQLIEDAQAAYGYVRTINGQYKSELRDPSANVPFYSKQTEREYKAILRMNPNTGWMPKDAPDNVRATEAPRGKLPSWIKKGSGDDFEPLTEAQVKAGRKLLREHAGSTDPNTQADLQRVRQRLGIFAEPDYQGEDDDNAGRPQRP